MGQREQVSKQVLGDWSPGCAVNMVPTRVEGLWSMRVCRVWGLKDRRLLSDHMGETCCWEGRMCGNGGVAGHLASMSIGPRKGYCWSWDVRPWRASSRAAAAPDSAGYCYSHKADPLFCAENFRKLLLL